MATAKQSKKSISITNQETMDKLESLLPDGVSNAEFIAELLRVYEVHTGKTASNSHDIKFTSYNQKADERVEKESGLREIFELNANDPLEFSEREILEKASELSGKSIEEMSIDGRLLVAKNIIGLHIKNANGKGKQAKSDENIAQIYNLLKETGQKITPNKLAVATGSRKETILRWCEKQGINFE